MSDLSLLQKQLGSRGLPLARAVMAWCRCQGDALAAVEHATSEWPHQFEVHRILRTAVNSGSLLASTWGSGLAASETIVSEFISASQAASVIGRLPGVHKIPPHTR